MQVAPPIRIGSVPVGGSFFTLIAGPCSIESSGQFGRVAQACQSVGAQALRGGIFKLRTHPQAFQGLGSAAYSIAHEVKSRLKMPLISEITDPRQIGPLGEVVDAFQVGTRNMYNYELLKELGQTQKPVVLKRGHSALIEEWLLAAEYVAQAGNRNVILCERGIRTFERATRNTLDLSAVAWVKARSEFPVLVDPSHGVGIPELIPAMCLASAAAGADGLMLEVHDVPAEALSDGAQALTPEKLRDIRLKLDVLLPALGRRWAEA